MGKVEHLLHAAKPGARRSTVDAETLAEFEPLNHLGHDTLAALAQVAQRITLEKGARLFTQGDIDPRVFYLTGGMLQLTSSKGSGETLDSGELRARSPVTTEKHRPCTAEALTEVSLVWLPSSAWEQAVSSAPAEAYEVEEIDTTDGATWIHNFLKSPVFLRLPAGNIQTILTRLEEVRVQPGQLILKQGSQANNYYVVKEGRFKVSRRPAQSDCTIELATLRAGDGFGEEALISHGQRNASVTALTSGALMRLGRQDFTQLLVDPLIRKMSLDAARHELSQGGALLDVRSSEEYRENGLRNALNIPLSLLRANLPELRDNTTYIVCCNNGLLGAAAAFVLIQSGKKAAILDGGLQNVAARAPARQATAPKPATPATPKSASATRRPKLVADAPISPNREIANQIALEKELAELKAKFDSLEEDIGAPVPATDTHATPTSIEQIICVDRDDALLWTPIPGTEHMSPAKLTIAAELKPQRAARNTQVVCVGEADAILWEPIVGPRRKQASALASSTAAPAEASAPVTKAPSGWISDNFLWETVLGYNSDPEVDELLKQAEANTREMLEETTVRSVFNVHRPAAKPHAEIIPGAPRSRDKPSQPTVAEKPRKQPKSARSISSTPWWLHGIYTLAALAALSAGYVTFYPNHPLSTQAISLLSSAISAQSAAQPPTSVPQTGAESK